MTYWKGRKVLITGANGFAGIHLCCSLLDAGANIRAFVKRGGALKGLEAIKGKVEITLGDVTDMPSLWNAMKDIDIVFNLAAVVPVMEARLTPQQTLNTNMLGAYNVALAAYKSQIQKMVHISTCHVYGNQPEYRLPLKEDTIPLPNDLYASSKYAAEIILRSLVNEGFPIVFTRAFNHYGPWQTGDFLVPRLISQVLQNKTPVLGSPRPTRDYSYAKDIARGYMLAGELGGSGEIYHFCAGKEISVGEICSKILATCESDVQVIWQEERKLDLVRSYGDCTKARTELGWVPEVSLDEGLKLTVDWWRGYLKLV